MREGEREGVARLPNAEGVEVHAGALSQWLMAGVIAVEGNATALCSAGQPAKLLQ